ncbi:hypothetical protein ES150_21610 [Enterobacillus tribolii]|uniref:putative zinc ribbon protein n=1 Tax=Enterobacillus tribolii TaxID=1487935 RepID=UPI000E1C7FFC|nr:hypothetical protein [Enterobacillus tribolii]
MPDGTPEVCTPARYADSSCDPAWFEHDQRSVIQHVLMNCAHLDPEVRAEARHRKLCNTINGLDASVTTCSWYCVWCSGHYCEDKYCASCRTGIYSIEQSSWQLNYCCNVSPE